MDLSESNLHAKAEWVVEYNFTSYYGINEITSENLHHLARKFVNLDQEITSLFERYIDRKCARVQSSRLRPT